MKEHFLLIVFECAGTPVGQVIRLLQPHFEWINLNPYLVLMLDIDATEEDIKQHYRKVRCIRIYVKKK